MNEISLSKIEFTLKATTLGMQTDDIHPKKQQAEAGQSNVDALKKFIELYGELSELMKEYKDLLTRDHASLEKVGKTMELQDEQLSSLWEKTGVFR